ncbi:MAG TPA: RICIN domain-containing protein [Trebonia sp.]
MAGTQGTAVRFEPCDGSAAQKWGDFSNSTGIPSTHGGLCLSAALPMTTGGRGIRVLDGTPVVVAPCDQGTMTTVYASDWTLMPDGQIFNADVNMCLADPGNTSANGTKLVLEDCYGDPGEIWAVG